MPSISSILGSVGCTLLREGVGVILWVLECAIIPTICHCVHDPDPWEVSGYVCRLAQCNLCIGNAIQSTLDASRRILHAAAWVVDKVCLRFMIRHFWKSVTTAQSVEHEVHAAGAVETPPCRTRNQAPEADLPESMDSPLCTSKITTHGADIDLAAKEQGGKQIEKVEMPEPVAEQRPPPTKPPVPKWGDVPSSSAQVAGEEIPIENASRKRHRCSDEVLLGIPWVRAVFDSHVNFNGPELAMDLARRYFESKRNELNNQCKEVDGECSSPKRLKLEDGRAVCLDLSD